MHFTFATYNEDSRRVTAECDEHGHRADITVPERWFILPSEDVEPVEMPCEIEQCPGTVTWAPPDDELEYRRRAERRIRQKRESRLKEWREMCDGEGAAIGLERRKRQTAQVVVDILEGRGKPTNEQIEVIVEELKDEDRWKVRPDTDDAVGKPPIAIPPD